MEKTLMIMGEFNMYPVVILLGIAAVVFGITYLIILLHEKMK